MSNNNITSYANTGNPIAMCGSHGIYENSTIYSYGTITYPIYICSHTIDEIVGCGWNRTNEQCHDNIFRYNKVITGTLNSGFSAIRIEAYQGGAYNNSFYENNITSNHWINDGSSEINYYYNNSKGNAYYFINNTPSWSVYPTYANNTIPNYSNGLNEYNTTTLLNNEFVGSNVKDKYPYTNLLYVAPCTEEWINNNTECNGLNYTILYYKNNSCTTNINLSILNGTIQNCNLENWELIIVPCIDNTKLISYTNTNNNSYTYYLPSNNGTYQSCYISATDGEIKISNAILALSISVLSIAGAIIFYSRRKEQ
jgi:hypothetical protein